jgi:hypothetical protein
VVVAVGLAGPEHLHVGAEVAEPRLTGLERIRRAASLVVLDGKRLVEIEDEPAVGRDVPAMRRVLGRRFVDRRHVYSNPVMADSLASDCCATTRRTVPERERMTIESVSAPPGE